MWGGVGWGGVGGVGGWGGQPMDHACVRVVAPVLLQPLCGCVIVVLWVGMQTPQGITHSPATEPQMWGYLVQLTAAVRAVHSASLVFRPACLAPSKVGRECMAN